VYKRQPIAFLKVPNNDYPRLNLIDPVSSPILLRTCQCPSYYSVVPNTYLTVPNLRLDCIIYGENGFLYLPIA
jgi:hypothetical protein